MTLHGKVRSGRDHEKEKEYEKLQSAIFIININTLEVSTERTIDSS